MKDLVAGDEAKEEAGSLLRPAKQGNEAGSVVKGAANCQ